jgi:hypothetical protein
VTQQPGGPEDGTAARRPAERRRLIQRAIRDRTEAPPGLEDLALRVALRQAGLRWISLLYGLGFVVEVVSLFLEHSNGVRLRDGVLALVFAGLGLQQYRVGRRAQEAVARWDRPAPAPTTEPTGSTTEPTESTTGPGEEGQGGGIHG